MPIMLPSLTSTSFITVSLTANVTWPDLTIVKDSIRACSFSSTLTSALKLTKAVNPCGVFLVGITTIFLSLNSLAWFAAIIILLLFGNMNIFLAFILSIAFIKSSVLGFIVWPPSII